MACHSSQLRRRSVKCLRLTRIRGTVKSYVRTHKPSKLPVTKARALTSSSIVSGCMGEQQRRCLVCNPQASAHASMCRVRSSLQTWTEAWLRSIRGSHAQVYGVIGNPVAHSRSPALHNTAMHAVGLDAVYVPLLVDDLQPFLDAFPDFSGFSVTIPHKVVCRHTMSMHYKAQTVSACV